MKFKEARKVAKQIIKNDLGTLHYWYEKGYSEWDNLSETEKSAVEKQINKILKQFERLIQCHVCGGKGYYDAEDSMLVDTHECDHCK
jgi:hypothetical protein